MPPTYFSRHNLVSRGQPPVTTLPEEIVGLKEHPTQSKLAISALHVLAIPSVDLESTQALQAWIPDQMILPGLPWLKLSSALLEEHGCGGSVYRTPSAEKRGGGTRRVLTLTLITYN